MKPKSFLLEELTWCEIEEAMKDGMKTVLIFAASTEQHGPQLAECTDTVLGYGEAVELARRLGDALVAPVIRPGLSKHHMVLPGTVSLRPETFQMLVEDYVESYLHHGFENIVLCASHGGNFDALQKIADEMQAKYPDRKIIAGMPISDVTLMLAELDRSRGLPEGTCGGHACRWETSLMLKLRPECVRMEKAQPGFVGEVTPEMLNKFFTQGVKAVSPIGVMGDPSGSTAEEGNEFFTILMDRVEADVKRKLGR